MSDILSDLTEAQREAVTHINGPLLVIAGPGSGKTRVITRRIAYLIFCGIRPWNILAITFTNKAAGEMRRRVDDLVEERGVWISTFHSFCARQLRRWADRLGYGRDFTIFDSDDSRKLITQIIKDEELLKEDWQPASVQAAISSHKSQLNTADDVARLAESTGEARQSVMARIYRRYQAELRRANCMDFDDLLMQMVLLLRRDADAVQRLAAQHQFVLVDEFQDTNQSQYEIVRLLSQGHRNLCATGDPDQSIYGWRGAEIRNILNFESDFPDAKVVFLERNYRSTGTILEAADAVVARNLKRKKRRLYTTNPEGEKIHITAFEDGAREAQAAAERIAENIAAGVGPDEIAVFYRVNWLSRQFEEALIDNGIAYQIVGGVEFYNRREVKDVLSYLRAVINPADETSLLRAINTPPRGVGKRSVEALREWARARGAPLVEAVKSDEARAALRGSSRRGVEEFNAILGRIGEAVAEGPRAALAAAMEKSGYLDMLRASRREGDEERVDNLMELLDAAVEFQESNPQAGVSEFLDHAALVSDIDNWHEDEARVTLMTMHAAKGLEFDVVFITALEESILPHFRSSDSLDELEEERRLFFVAMTRARKRLYLSYADERLVFGEYQRNLPSRFMGEIPAELLQPSLDEEPDDRAGFTPVHPAARPAGRARPRRRKEAAVLAPGTEVRSDKFGLGVVEYVESQGRYHKAAVRFGQAGRKVLVLEKANLEVVST